MRVIAGKARRILLKTVEGQNTRPTTDRIKETLFNMLQNDLYDCRFLDLFAGSGGIGIEALSRGAKEAVFVENNRNAISCIQDNLKATHLEAEGQVIGRDVMTALELLETEPVFDLVFMDPPYRQSWEQKVLERLRNSGCADSETLFIVEAALDTDFSYLEELGYQIVRKKEYKTNMHVFIKFASS